MKAYTGVPFKFLVFSLISCSLAAPITAQNGAGDAPGAQPAPPYQRPISWAKLIPKIAEDQSKVWLFPTHLNRKRVWIPTVAILGTTAALIALDSRDGSYFRRTSTFSGFNNVFTGNATAIGTAVAPASLYVAGLFTKDPKMKGTALLAGEAVADSEILAYVLKTAIKRERPTAVNQGGNLWDTWWESRGSVFSGRGGMPSGHAIAAFSVATIVARRYGNHKWIPPVAYGLAALVGFSRVTSSQHFISDVFVGAALGYSVSRFAVLQQ
jgi:membrane-associated phospholipid phosphatase